MKLASITVRDEHVFFLPLAGTVQHKKAEWSAFPVQFNAFLGYVVGFPTCSLFCLFCLTVRGRKEYAKY